MIAARERIAERVKNAYASGYEDARADRAGRMDEVADAETAKILEVVADKFRISYVNESYDQPWCPGQYQVAVWWEDDSDPMVTGHIFEGDASDSRDDAYRTAFQHGLEHTLYSKEAQVKELVGADDDGGER